MTGAWCVDEPCLGGRSVVWTDTLGVQNARYSDPAYTWNAHVEAPEPGVHKVTIENQPGCTVGVVTLNFFYPQTVGPTTISVEFPSSGNEDVTFFVDVACV
jgi:hypothetical protein